MSPSPPTPSGITQAATAIDWSRLVDLVRRHQRFLVTTHIRPDCDAIGSALGMAAILESLGKEAMVVTGFDVPPVYAFLDPHKRIKRIGRDVTDQQLAAIEVLIVVDTSAWAQLGDMGELIRTTTATKVVLDHHVSADDLGAEEFRDTSAEASGRIVYDAARQLGVAITPEIAEKLFVALATDTGWFRFASTSADTYRLAASLTDAGAVPDTLYQNLYEKETHARVQLKGRVLARSRTELDGRLIYTWIEREDFEATGAIPSDSEDLINLTLAVGGTEVAVILVEQAGGGSKISFRSRSDLDCAQLASQFGGGGHKKAAGAFVDGPLAEARTKVLDAVRAAMR